MQTDVVSEMYAQLRQIDTMDAAALLSYMDGLYEHDLTSDSPLHELRAETKRQCRRDYQFAMTESERADLRYVEALVAVTREGRSS